MKYRQLGRSGLRVSRISLGSMTFGAPNWGCEEKESHAIIRAYIEAGGNFIDTADIYAGGRSEEIIGSIMPELRRDELVFATKVYFPDGSGPNSLGTSRKRIVANLERSLKRMRTDHVDLLYIHGPDPVTPFEETLAAMDMLVRQGKVLYLGCSNIFAWQIAKAQGIAAARGLTPFVGGQYLYNLIHREPELEIIPAAVDQGVGLVTWSPLGGGLLTGKYAGIKEPGGGSRLEHRIKVDGPRFWHKRGFKTAEALGRIAAKAGVSPALLAVAWPLSRDAVSAVTIGVRSLEQLKENMQAGDWDVPPSVLARLDDATTPEYDYLVWFNFVNNYPKLFGAADRPFPAAFQPKI